MFYSVEVSDVPQVIQNLAPMLIEASTLLADEYQLYLSGEQFAIDTKQDSSPVTQADLKANHFITTWLKQYSPDIPILSEEGEHIGRESWAQYWLLDPLDGTKEFVRKTGEFTINLSLMNGADTSLSVIAVPLKKQFYIALVGQLPFRAEWVDGVVQWSQYQHEERVRNQSEITIAVSRGAKRHARYLAFEEFLRNQGYVINLIHTGSAYKFCLMLEGEVDIYPRFHPTSEWDTAAGQGLLQAIGGELFDLQHRPFQYNQRESLLNGNFIALRCADEWVNIGSFLSSQGKIT